MQPVNHACFLTGAPLLVGEAWLAGHGLLVRDGVIEAVLPCEAETGAPRVGLPPDALLAPGLIDIQVNGGGGLLFNDRPDVPTALAIAASHRLLGTTSILPTLITDARPVMAQVAATIAACPPDRGILGVHFEGPFLSPSRPGVHRAADIRAPDEDDLARLENLAARIPGRVLLTLAPEMVEDSTLARLAGAGIILAAGHSEASYERAVAALRAGLAGFTHLFNAMPAISARAPGLITAALLDPGSFCGVIADGIHVHPALLRLLLATKPADRILLVSDAMPPAGTALAGFALQGRAILRAEGRLVTDSGTLAGADICLAEAVRRIMRLGGLSAARALSMATAVPAAFLRLDHQVGHIAPGRRADFVLLSQEMEVLGTWLGGHWQGDPGILNADATPHP